MKQFLCMFAAALVMCACNVFDEVAEAPTPDTVKVGIKFSGDVISTSTAPLSRATIKETTYYGVNILSNESDFKYEMTGVFDSPENISVELPKGHNYLFTCFAVKGIEEYSYDYYDDGSASFDWFPFRYYKVEDIGKFVNGFYLNYYSLENQRVDASLGITECMLTAAEESVNIDLKRVSMGVNFVVNPPAEGVADITAACFYYPNDTYNYSLFKATVASTDSPVYDKFLLMAYRPDYAWEAAAQGSYKYYNSSTGKYEYFDEYFELLKIDIAWTHEDGTKETFASQSIKIFRNKMATISITLDSGGSGEPSEGNNITITEDDPMEDGDTNNITVSGGKITNTVVAPNQE